MTCGGEVVIEDSLRNHGLIRQDGVVSTAEGAGVIADSNWGIVKIVPILLLLLRIIVHKVVSI